MAIITWTNHTWTCKVCRNHAMVHGLGAHVVLERGALGGLGLEPQHLFALLIASNTARFDA